MPEYWITAHVEESYIVNASSPAEAIEMVYNGDVTSRGDGIVEVSIDHISDSNV